MKGTHPERTNALEPKPRRRDLTPPEDASAEVLAVWTTTVAELEHMGTAFASDADSLRCYWEAVVVHRKASAILTRSPILVKGLHISLVRNPELQIQRDAAQAVRGFAQEFGLTPTARTAVQAHQPDDDPAAGTHGPDRAS
jgi:P27 family predicted phage terminase small subunit